MIDTHCHLNYPDFDRDRDAMLQRAAGAGVERFVTVATGPHEWQRCLDLCEGRPAVRVALGVHPNEADAWSEQVGRDLQALSAADPRVVAIGETGLDFFRDGASREQQLAAFHGQLAIARALNKPFILHCRAADAELLEVLEAEQARHGGPLNGVWHCFSTSAAFAPRAVALGLYFGLGGVITYPKSNELREILKTLPAERLLLETDCPFLPPQGWRGQRNEPAYLTKVVEVLAETRGVSREEIRAQTDTNARRLFALA